MKMLSVSISALAACLTFLEPALGGSPSYQIHEWGTFTTVSGSDGALLSGLHREEESLPGFVYSADSVARTSLKMGRPLKNVTVKMETPVLYFYSDNEDNLPVEVKVGFDGGSITEWFPERSGGETWPAMFRRTEGGPLSYPVFDLGKKRTGSIEWKLDILPASPENDGLAFQFRDRESETWTYPRMTRSNVVRVSNNGREEYEKYLFYRGIGNFSLPLEFRMQAGGELTIENRSPDAVPQALVFSMEIENGQKKAGFSLLGTVAADQEKLAEVDGLSLSAAWRRDVYAAVVGMLVDSGLFRDEADSMVRTWWHSYFERPGTRVFWIAPDAFTDRVLPLEASPAPDDIVRVLVGRAEVLSPEFEQELLADSQDPDRWKKRWADRYFFAYNKRVEALKKPEVSAVGKP